MAKFVRPGQYSSPAVNWNSTPYYSTVIIDGPDTKNKIDIRLDWGDSTARPGNICSLNQITDSGNGAYTLVPPTEETLLSGQLWVMLPSDAGGQLVDSGGEFYPGSSLGTTYLDDTTVPIVPWFSLAANTLNVPVVLESDDVPEPQSQVYGNIDGKLYLKAKITGLPAIGVLHLIQGNTVPSTAGTYAMLVKPYGAPTTSLSADLQSPSRSVKVANIRQMKQRGN